MRVAFWLRNGICFGDVVFGPCLGVAVVCGYRFGCVGPGFGYGVCCRFVVWRFVLCRVFRSGCLRCLAIGVVFVRGGGGFGSPVLGFRARQFSWRVGVLSVLFVRARGLVALLSWALRLRGLRAVCRFLFFFGWVRCSVLVVAVRGPHVWVGRGGFGSSAACSLNGRAGAFVNFGNVGGAVAHTSSTSPPRGNKVDGLPRAASWARIIYTCRSAIFA